MRKVLLAFVVVALVPRIVAAAPIPLTFDLRDPSIEAIDEVNSFTLFQDGLSATLTALPTTFGGRSLLLNQTSSSFGINVDGTTCSGREDSGTIDGGCIGEAISVVFNTDVLVNSLRVSSFGSLDRGTAMVGASLFGIQSTGVHSLGDSYLTAGDELLIAFTAGNGFSLDNFTVTVAEPVPEPGSLALLGAGIVGAITRRRARRNRI